MKNKVLVLADYYLPGFKAGGPIRSLENITQYLGGEIDFVVLTNDRDYGDRHPYSGVDTRVQQQVGYSQVKYLSKRERLILPMLRTIRFYDVNVIYLNSVFSFYYTIQVLFLRRIGCLKGVKIIVASRGEFSQGALNIKKMKKKTFLFLSKIFGFYKNVLWQASSYHEQEDIRRVIHRNAIVAIVPNIPNVDQDHQVVQRNKQPGHLNIVFLSRITRKKNLLFAIESLRTLKGDVHFHVYGPIEDQEYWRRCLIIAEVLPANIHFSYKGIVAPPSIQETLGKYDVFYLPTFGENFGHVVFEAISSGCPILISDTTPWRGLEKLGIGWDIDLQEKHQFIEQLQILVEMPKAQHQEFVNNARNYASRYANDPHILRANRVLFQHECVNL